MTDSSGHRATDNNPLATITESIIYPPNSPPFKSIYFQFRDNNMMCDIQRSCRSPGRWHWLLLLGLLKPSLHHGKPPDWSGTICLWWSDAGCQGYLLVFHVHWHRDVKDMWPLAAHLEDLEGADFWICWPSFFFWDGDFQTLDLPGFLFTLTSLLQRSWYWELLERWK